MIRMCIMNTRNNTIANITQNGDVKMWVSAGTLGFKGSKKSTKYAAELVVEKLASKAIEQNFTAMHVSMKGIGYGKQSAVRALARAGVKVLSLRDETPVVFNGCRPPKKPRL